MFPKTNFSYPLIHKRTYAYQRVRNVGLPGRFRSRKNDPPSLSGNNYLWLLKLPILVSLPKNPVKDYFSHFSWSKLFTSKVLWKFVTQENILHIKFKPKLQFFTSTSYELTNCIYIPWRTSSSLAKNSLTNFSWIPLHSRNTNKLVWRWFAP